MVPLLCGMFGTSVAFLDLRDLRGCVFPDLEDKLVINTYLSVASKCVLSRNSPLLELRGSAWFQVVNRSRHIGPA